MKFFKSPLGNVNAYLDDGSQDSFIALDAIPLSAEEIAIVTNPNSFHTFDNGTWVFSLSAAKAAKRLELQGACSSSIVAGVPSDALGAVYTYPTGTNDQIVLASLVAETLLSGSGDAYKFWCGDINGVWARRVHTKAQIQQVSVVVNNYIKDQQDKYEQKLDEVDVATADSLPFVVWGP
jgi:hypothetical protein